MKVIIITGAFLACMTGPVFSWSPDPCVEEERKFATSADALRGQTAIVAAKFSDWYTNPDSIPEDVLINYRKAVRDYAFGIWSKSPTGQGILKSWGEMQTDFAKGKFHEFVYINEINPELEKKLAQALYKKDYDENIKKDIDKLVEDTNADIRSNQEKLDDNCSQTVFAQFARTTLGNAIIMVKGNFDAAKNEDGDVAAAVRAVSGISITDILENGFEGGENSEMAKFNRMLDGVLEANGMGPSTVVGQIFSAINPTKWQVEVPKINVDTTITVDEDSLENVIKNTTIIGVVSSYCDHNWCP